LIPNLNALWARVLVGELAGGGVRHLCASPGSRSSPLIIAAHEHPHMRVTLHLDERSASFFALGIARATGTPVALLCTSGTAAANFFPAIIEASQSGIPLVVLTADRPPELRGSGAPQTIDQVHLYGRYVRAFNDLPVPEAGLAQLRTAGAIAAHAASRACQPAPGPVHLNIPLREPLAPVPQDADAVQALAAEYEASLHGEPRQLAIDPQPGRLPSDRTVNRLADLLNRSLRPLLIAGPTTGADREGAGAVLSLAAATGIPLLADVASGIRFRAGGSAMVCGHADLFLRSDAFAAGPGPDLVLLFGGVPVSKAIQETIVRHRAFVVSIQPDAARRDPEAVSSWIVQAGGPEVCDRLLPRLEGSGEIATRREWKEKFVAAESTASRFLSTNPLPLEAASIRETVATLPQNTALFLSNSMPIRWAEAYCAVSMAGTAVYASRGASGIDGITSTALGVAFGLRRPLLLVTGDVAFLHDLGGLFAARHLEQPVVILLLNNDGGGVFSFLPIGAFPDLCAPLFRVAHGGRLEAAAGLFGLEHSVARDAGEAVRLAGEGLRRSGVRIIEVRTEADAMVREHRELLLRLEAAVCEALPGGAA
jgi:2-succinyl-5-enolpyruvyl-6-hydroxy-3-cyclohexene-1-carboxylate synthase